MSTDSEAKNRAVIYANPPEITTRVEELPIPKPGSGEVLVRL
jgi:NADPH:quinone reductase-like Zn-dependent oxidoreductase